MLTPIHINATSIPDAWFQTLYACVDVGRRFKIDRGSYAGQDRLEFDYITVSMSTPDSLPLLPKLFNANIPDPVAEDYLSDYLPYLMTAEVKEGESYTYGQRLNGVPVDTELIFNPEVRSNASILIQEPGAWEASIIRSEFPGDLLSQIELMIWTYKNKGHRNNQMVLQVAQPSDMLLQDPPCLRQIDTRIQDGILHFFPYFRSWDLFGGFPANLAAIELLKQHCAAEIGVENGMIIASSKGLHIYDYVIEISEMIRGKSAGEFRQETLDVLQNRDN